jgi:hypothetical protein
MLSRKIPQLETVFVTAATNGLDHLANSAWMAILTTIVFLQVKQLQQQQQRQRQKFLLL